MVPKPLRKPHPPLRIAATSPDTFPAIGAMGLPIFVAVRLGTLDQLGPDIKAYREAYRAAGHPGDGEVYLRVPIYVGDNEASARTDPEQSIMQFYRTLALQVQDSATRPGARAIERRAERGQALGAVTYDEALREKVIVGTPDSVTARLKELIGTIGLDGVLAELNCGGMLPDEKVMRSLKLMCEEVAPRVR
jgi:alkanesulfonate monooxygenase SsuD/methylene tetrahydromethanopterin reductase-like flavin-dependent oxidoreductase (luciferase family)